MGGAVHYLLDAAATAAAAKCEPTAAAFPTSPSTSTSATSAATAIPRCRYSWWHAQTSRTDAPPLSEPQPRSARRQNGWPRRGRYSRSPEHSVSRHFELNTHAAPVMAGKRWRGLLDTLAPSSTSVTRPFHRTDSLYIPLRPSKAGFGPTSHLSQARQLISPLSP